MSWPDPGFLLSPLPTRHAWSSATSRSGRRPAAAAVRPAPQVPAVSPARPATTNTKSSSGNRSRISTGSSNG